ncbi:maleylpyruvate isomerase family mycothiol-dependent enzyme [Actinopolymorpha sp. NPDC004070]|uniref:maleylpyruvate isomerase family mycothiol-dependent enzyme n=1 Tax=Actinopolymorpha sp. NPDC004070 TaxID=3154548 RepID=UPI0033A5D3B8
MLMDLIAAERGALADVLGKLDAGQWRAPSLCTGWTVSHVVAHLTMPFRISEQEFTDAMRRAGGRFTVVSDEIAERDSRLPPAQLADALRDNVHTNWSPPGGGLAGALSHDVIHGLDIARPLGIQYPIPDAALTTVLDLLTGPEHAGADGANPFGFRLDGRRLSATDLDWSAGSGETVAAPAGDLVLLAAGRRLP